MWAAEMLFALRVHPQTRVVDVPDLRALVVKGQELLEAAVERRRPTTWVFERRRMPVPALWHADPDGEDRAPGAGTAGVLVPALPAGAVT